MKAIHVRHLTAEDFRREGELLWRDFKENFTTESLIVAEMDFSDLYKSYKTKIEMTEPKSEPASSPAGGPPPPPPLPLPAMNGSKSPPPPPPPPSLSSGCLALFNILDFITFTFSFSTEAPPPPPPPSLTSVTQPRLVPHLTPLHWRPILRPPVTDSSLWSDLPCLQIDKEQLEEQFKVLPHEQKKLAASSKQKPKLLNVLDLKVTPKLP